MNKLNINSRFTFISIILKKSLFIVVLCLFSSVTFSQTLQERVDKLLHKIDSVDNDSTKAASYLTLSRLNLYSNPEASNEYAQQAVNHSVKSQYWQALFEAYRTKFNAVYSLSSNTDSLLKYVQLEEQCLKEKGIWDEDKGDQINVYLDYGLYYEIAREIDKQLDSYLKALRMTREYSSDPNREAMLLNNIGMVYDARGQTYKALASYQAALKLVTNKMHKGNMLLNCGLIYRQIFQKVDSAQLYFKPAFELYEEVNSAGGMAMILLEQGAIYDMKKQYEIAYTSYQKAEQLIKENNIGSQLPTLYQFLTDHFYEQEKYNAAIEYAEKSISIAVEQGNISEISYTYEQLYKSYEAVGNYKRAFEVQGDLMAWNDSLNNVELMAKVETLRTEFDVEQKEIENTMLKNDLKNRRWLSAALIAALLFAIAWGFSVYRSNQLKTQQNEILEAKVKQRTADLEQANYELRTFNYIASHDIKEPIRNIGSYASLIFRRLPDDLKNSLGDYFTTIKKNTAQLYTLIEDFARYTTLSKDESVDKQDVNLNELVSGVEAGLETAIQKYNGKVIHQDLPTISSNNSLLYTIFKNIIENGLKYNQSDAPTVEIGYQKTSTHHQISFKDNGIGIAPEYHERIFEMFKRLHNRAAYEGSGIGLAIAKLSTNKLAGEIQLNSAEGKGSEFVIKLPVS